MQPQPAFHNGRYVGPERRAAWRAAANMPLQEPGALARPPLGSASFGAGASTAIDWPKSILDELGHGVLLLGPDLHLMLINRLAEAELTEQHPLMLEGRQLQARDAQDDLRLQEALQGASQRGLQRLLPLGQGLQRISLRVVPLGADSLLGGARPVMLQLNRRHVCEPLSLQWFAREYGLTSAETDVLQRLCQGQTPRQIAEARQVGLATVRAQIGSIREKTGAGSIRELGQMLAMLPPMVSRLRPRA